MMCFVNAFDLDVHLNAGDAVFGARDFEIHIAEVIFVTEDVGEDRDARAFLDQAHRDTRDWLRIRNARVHQRHRSRANRAHRGRAVGLSSVSQTMRTVYGNLSYAGIIALIERSARAPWPISRRL